MFKEMHSTAGGELFQPCAIKDNLARTNKKLFTFELIVKVPLWPGLGLKRKYFSFLKYLNESGFDGFLSTKVLCKNSSVWHNSFWDRLGRIT